MTSPLRNAAFLTALILGLSGCGDGQHIDGLADPGAGEEVEAPDAALVEHEEPRQSGPPPAPPEALVVDAIEDDGLPLVVDDLMWEGDGEMSFLLSMAEPVAGVRLSALGKEAFDFAEDGVPLGREVLFTLEHQADLRIALVLDVSRSMLEDDALISLKTAVRELLQATPWGTEVAVIWFATDYAVAQEFTTDAGALVRAVDALEIPEGRAGQFTNLWGATRLAAELLEKGDEEQGRAVVLFTDGRDNVAEVEESAARAALTRARAVTYAVGLGDELDAEQLILVAGEDRFASASRPSGLGALFADIATRLGEIVRITYTTPKRTGTHTLSMTVKAMVEHEERRGVVDIVFERPEE